MTVTYWREHSNPELSSESALATFNPIIKLALPRHPTPSSDSFRRKIDGESGGMDGTKTRKRVCVCARGREISLAPYLPFSTPNRFDEGNRAVRNLHSQISFSSDVFAPLIRIISTVLTSRHLWFIIPATQRGRGGRHRCRLFSDYGYIKPQVRDRVKLPRHGWEDGRLKVFVIMNDIIGFFFFFLSSLFLVFFFRKVLRLLGDCFNVSFVESDNRVFFKFFYRIRLSNCRR